MMKMIMNGGRNEIDLNEDLTVEQLVDKICFVDPAWTERDRLEIAMHYASSPEAIDECIAWQENLDLREAREKDQEIARNIYLRCHKRGCPPNIQSPDPQEKEDAEWLKFMRNSIEELGEQSNMYDANAIEQENISENQCHIRSFLWLFRGME